MDADETADAWLTASRRKMATMTDAECRDLLRRWTETIIDTPSARDLWDELHQAATDH
jgi:hypothetical protein